MILAKLKREYKLREDPAVTDGPVIERMEYRVDDIDRMRILHIDLDVLEYNDEKPRKKMRGPGSVALWGQMRVSGTMRLTD